MEIKLKDLRVGNLVYDPEGDECKVFNIYHAGGVDLIYDHVLIENVNIQSITPIELNGDELERLGFKKDGEYYVIKPEFHDDGYYFDLSKKCLTNGIPCFANSFYNIDTEYVHQLQNLYYALTGIEL